MTDEDTEMGYKSFGIEKGRLSFCLIAPGIAIDLFTRSWYYIYELQGENVMAVTYKKLLHLRIDKDVSNAELVEQAGFSANIITRLKWDNYLSLDTIEKICNTLNCGVDDILEFIPDGIERIKHENE